MEKPMFGHGLEMMGEHFEGNLPREIEDLEFEGVVMDRAHNEYLDIGFSVGVPGLLLYLMVIFLVVKRGFEAGAVRRYFAIGMSGFLVANFFGFSTVVHQAFFWGMAGMILSDTGNERERCCGIGRFVLLIVIILAMKFLVIDFVRADGEYRKGAIAVAKGRSFEAMDHLVRAIDLFPWEKEYREDAEAYYEMTLPKMKGGGRGEFEGLAF